MNVTVIPECCGRLRHVQFRVPCLARSKGQLRPTIHIARDMRPMPMGGDRIIGRVCNRQTRRLPAFHAQRRTKIVKVIAKRRGLHTAEEFLLATPRGQQVARASIDIHHRWDRQGSPRFGRNRAIDKQGGRCHHSEATNKCGATVDHARSFGIGF